MDAVKLLLQEPAGAIINVKKKNNSDLNCKRRMTAEVDYSPVFFFTEKNSWLFFSWACRRGLRPAGIGLFLSLQTI